MIGTRDPFDYLDCEDCGCLQIASIPVDLEDFYTDGYYTRSQRTRIRKRGGALGLRRRWSRIRLRAGRFARLISGRRYGRFDWFRLTGTGLADEILDVGCGSGRLLWRLHAEGFERLTGIDLRPEAEDGGTRPATSDAQKNSGPRILRASPEELDGRFRLVMAHHSFEHMSDPRGVFDAFARLVEPGGTLLLRLPRADSWARRRYGADWVQLDAPRHLHLHTRRSLEKLAAGSGFRITRVVDDSGPFQIWGSELYRRDISLADARQRGIGWRAHLAARFRAGRLRREGLGDQACFYLQRDH